MLYAVKLIVTAVLIVAITEVAKLKHLGYLAGLIAALPIVSLISIFWMYFEGGDKTAIARFSMDVFWFVLPTLPFFIALPLLLKHLSFGVSMGIAVAITFVCFGITMWALGIDIRPA